MKPSRTALGAFDALVCDMDGVLYRGDVAVPGAAEAIGRLRGDGVRIVFATNNSNPTVATYVERLRAMGIEADPDDVVTSAVATASVLKERGYSGRNVYVIGGEGIRAALAEAGLDVLDDRRAADVVVVGWDPTFTYEQMRAATHAVLNGAELFATNSDASFPAPDGLWPGAGAILASIERATGVSAEVMGKPNPPMLDVVQERLGDADRVVCVGDRPETDLAGASARGWTTVLVLTGVVDARDVHRVQPPPDVVLPSIADLVQ